MNIGTDSVADELNVSSTVPWKSVVVAAVGAMVVVGGVRYYLSRRSAEQKSEDINAQPGIMDIGKEIMDNYVGYAGAVILPPVFHSNLVDYMQNIDQPTHAQRNFISSQQGADAERLVYNYFSDIKARNDSDEDFITLHSFEITSNMIKVIKNNFPEKENSLNNFYEKYFIKKSGKQKIGKYEWDFIVISRDIGIAIVEVKASYQASAYEQLDRGEMLINDFIELLSMGYLGLPIIKVLALPTVPECGISSQRDGYLHLTQDDFAELGCPEQKISLSLDDKFKHDLKNFLDKSWILHPVLFYLLRQFDEFFNSIINIDKFYQERFNSLIHLITGVWCLNAVDLKNPKFDLELCSRGPWVKRIDDELRQAFLSVNSTTTNASKPKNPEFILFVEATLRKSFAIRYLTKQQEEVLYDNDDKFKHVLLTGAAGSGKTICLLMKIVLLLKKNKDAKIVFITTVFHSVNCANLLKKCGVKSEVFPGTANINEILDSTANVVILTFDFSSHNWHGREHSIAEDGPSFIMSFTDYSRRDNHVEKPSPISFVLTLLTKLPLTYHILIDEYQIIQAYISCTKNLWPDIISDGMKRPTFWLACDSTQHSFYCLDGSISSFGGNYRSRISNDMEAIKKNIEVFSLSSMLRNTVELSQIIQLFFKEANKDENNSVAELRSIPTVGHNIHGFKPKVWYFQKTGEHFEIAQFRIVVKLNVLFEMKKLMEHRKLKFSDFAILYDHGFESVIGDELKKIGVPCQSILENARNPGSNSVTADSLRYSFSHEWPVVFAVCTGKLLFEGQRKDFYSMLYLACSRARVMLYLYLANTSIDVSESELDSLNKLAYVRIINLEESQMERSITR